MRGEPLTGSPLAFNHPPAGEHFCYAKVLLQKENTILTDGVFFLEQGTGIEPALTAWEAAVIPIYQPCDWMEYIIFFVSFQGEIFMLSLILSYSLPNE